MADGKKRRNAGKALPLPTVSTPRDSFLVIKLSLLRLDNGQLHEAKDVI